jgi:hypothetical protein
MMDPSRLWAATLLLAVFAAGAVFGGVASRAWGIGDPAPEVRRRDRTESTRRPNYAERLEIELSLTTEQRAEVDSILQRQQSEMQVLWSEMRPQFDALRDGVRDQIMAILYEDQQAKYRELMARSDRWGDRERGTTNHR